MDRSSSDERFDRFIDRMDAHIERMDAHNERIDTVVPRIEEEMRHSRRDRADLRIFIRDVTRRNERVLGEMIASLVSMREGLDEMKEEIRATTSATWAMVDRLS